MSYSKEFLTSLYETMFKIRRFEEEGVKLYRQGHIRGYFHPYWGEEAIATGVCAALREGDYIASTHRGHGHCIAWGADLDRMVAELLGKKTGYCKGLGGSMHIADVTKGNLGANGIVGSGVPIAVGAALGISLRGEKNVSSVFLSDGASNIGSFTEGMNLASAWKLPVLFIIENNQYAVSTPIAESTGEPELYKRAHAFGIESQRVDGNNVIEVHEKAKEYVERCRKGEGPFLMECVTFRKSGHHVNDPGLYMPKDKLEYYEKHDPLKIGEELLSKNGLSVDDIKTIQKNVEEELESAISFGKDSPELTEAEFLQFISEY